MPYTIVISILSDSNMTESKFSKSLIYILRVKFTLAFVFRDDMYSIQNDLTITRFFIEMN